jgi:hypothetical protein
MHGVEFLTWCLTPHVLSEHDCEMLGQLVVGGSNVADGGPLRGSFL